MKPIDERYGTMMTFGEIMQDAITHLLMHTSSDLEVTRKPDTMLNIIDEMMLPQITDENEKVSHDRI